MRDKIEQISKEYQKHYEFESDDDYQGFETPGIKKRRPSWKLSSVVKNCETPSNMAL